MTEEQLQVIKERLEKATKWSRVMTTSVGTFGVDKKLEKFMETGSYEDAVFIAHSKSDMTDLIAEVERLRAENTELENELNDALVRCVQLAGGILDNVFALGGDRE